MYDLRLGEPVVNLLGPHLCGDAIDINPHDGTVVTGSYVQHNPIQFWDLRKAKTCTSCIDWNGGLRDSHGKEFIHHDEEEYKQHH